MRVFVTGANGFVGQHLCAHLLSSGHEVTAAVRRRGSAPDGCREVTSPNLGPAADWSHLLVNHDALIHLAARVHVMEETSENPLGEFQRVNAHGTRQLTIAAVSAGVRTVVLLSTIKVNGERTTGAAFDAFSRPAPLDPYGVSKYEAEQALIEEVSGTGTDGVIVRTPLVYGPRVGGNFRRMLRLVASGLPLPLGGIDNRRSMVSVWNLADLLEIAIHEPGLRGAVVVAGDSYAPSTPELLGLIAKTMRRRSQLIPVPISVLSLVGRLARKETAIDRLTSSLEVTPGSSTTGWTWVPPVSFEHGIQRTVHWFESQPSKKGRNN